MKISKEKYDFIVNLYKEGKTLKEVGKIFNVTDRTILNILDSIGIKRRTISEAKRKLKIDETVFDIVTDESAYWIGFLMADGYIVETKKCSPTLGITLIDKEHLYKFKNFL